MQMTWKDKVNAFLMSKSKGNIGMNSLISFAVLLVVASLVAGFGAQILTSIQSTMTADTSAYNATGAGITGIANMTGQFGNLGLIISAVVIIGLLVGGFMVFGNRGRE